MREVSFHIEKQEAASNVCAFTAALFLQKAFNKLKALYKAEDFEQLTDEE